MKKEMIKQIISYLTGGINIKNYKSALEKENLI